MVRLPCDLKCACMCVRVSTSGRCLRHFLLCYNQVVDVGLVVLAVMESHDFSRDVRLQVVVVVRKVGKCVLLAPRSVR